MWEIITVCVGFDGFSFMYKIAQYTVDTVQLHSV